MGGGPIGPVFPTFNPFVDPEQFRRQQFEEQRIDIVRLRQEIEEIRSELERSREEQGKKLIDGLVQVASSAFDKAIAYTNLIIVAGYGAFFGLWTLAKADLAPLPSALALILILISAATFVFFEVYRMAYTTVTMRDLYSLINQDGPLPVNVMLKRMNEFQTRSRKLTLSFHKSWELTLLVCVSTGVFAVLILFGTLLHQLFTILNKLI